MKNTALKSLLFALTLSATLFAAPVVDLSKIAGKSESEVAEVLGTPERTENTKYGKKNFYEPGETEIVFIKEKADWITIKGINEVPFDRSALSALGLEETAPTFSNSFTMRWENLNGILEVSIFKGRKNCDYAYIKIKTK